MARTVADQFADTIAAAGVKHVYGIAGDSLKGPGGAIRRQGKIEWLHVRHEEVTVFAAGVETHLTGEPAVCAGGWGPGNLHLINGPIDCHRSRLPVLATVKAPPPKRAGLLPPQPVTMPAAADLERLAALLNGARAQRHRRAIHDS